MNDFNLLGDLLDLMEIPYSDIQINQFIDYYNLLIEWNSFMNLTSITDVNDVIIKHFIDSILALKFYDFNNSSLIDVGTGAGFPGIPIKIMCPDVNIVLVDSLNKRIKFLNNVISNIGLSNISCIHSRAEDLAHNNIYRESFDYCVSRAVANLSTLSEYCLPFLKQGGIFISYKSDKSDDEINLSSNAFSLLSSKLLNVNKISIPNTDIFRYIVSIQKCGNVKKIYPRKAGIPLKNPL